MFSQWREKFNRSTDSVRASLQIKLLVLLLTAIFLLVGLGLWFTVSAINRLESEVSQARLQDESRIIQGRFLEIEEELTELAVALRNDPEFIAAVESRNTALLQGVVVGYKLRHDIDYVELIDPAQKGLTPAQMNEVQQVQGVRTLLSRALLTIEDTALLWSSDGWMLVSAVYVGTANQVEAAVLVGKLVNPQLLNEINFDRQDPSLLLFRQDGQLTASSTFNETVNDDQPHLHVHEEGADVEKIDVNLLNRALSGSFVLAAHSGNANAVVAYAPLYVSEKPVAVYGVELSTAEIDQLRNQIISQIAALVVAVSVVTAAVLLFLVNRFVTSPLKQLSEAAVQIGVGNFGTPIPPVKSKDEIGLLTTSFKRMVRRIRQSQKALMSHSAILEKRNEELEQFAYITSHDLKAPLRAIGSLTEWIEEDIEEFLTEETRGYMDKLRGRVERMEGLINGILDYSRAGRSSNQIEEVDVQLLLDDVVEFLAPPPTFTITIGSGMPLLQTEQIKLQQVFANLIGNAVKYHDRVDGQIDVTVIAEENETFHFVIADDGPGIAPEYHEKIFVIFQTLQARDSYESTGIGLSLVKKIIEEHGGKIWLDSALGQGASFHFTWPRVTKSRMQIGVIEGIDDDEE